MTMPPLSPPVLLPRDIETHRAHKAGVALGVLVRSYRGDLTRFRRDVQKFVSDPYHGHPAKTLIRGGFLLGYLGMEKATTDIEGNALPPVH